MTLSFGSCNSFNVGIEHRTRSAHYEFVKFSHGILLTLLLGLMACQRPADRADLVFINGAEPETLDPALITGQPEGRIANALFEGLLRFGADGKPVPGMAESWQVSEDGLTYVFQLRPNARWSNGRPVTAADFVASWQRTLSPSTASQYAYQLYYLKNAQAYNEGSLADFSQVGVKALDDQTLEVTLKNPTPFFLDLCAFVTLQPVPVEVCEAFGDSWIKPENIVTNGPYLLEYWGINDRIRLRKNPEYWEADKVALETIDVLPISKANTAFNFYASGNADLMMDKGLAPPFLLSELKKREDFHAAPFLGTYFLRFNCERSPFRDQRVRRAFSLVIDRKVIVEKITRAGELPAAGFVPPGIEGYPPVGAAEYNLEEARRLLADAGFPNGEGFPLTRYLYSEGELNEAIAIELQAMWRNALGVNVSLVRQEWKVYLNSLSSLDYDIARSSWVGDYPDPNTFLDMFVTGGGNNRTGWSDPAYDQLIQKAARELNPVERFGTLRQAEELLLREAPICPLYFYVGIQLYDPTVWGGIQANVLDEHPLRAIYRKTAP